MKFRKIIFLFAAALMMAFSYAAPVHAKTVWESPDNPCNKLSLGGDLRYRLEQSETKEEGGPTVKDVRRRVRLRFGGVYNTGQGIEAGFRIATGAGATAIHSTHNTLGQVNNAAGHQISLDRAYIKRNTRSVQVSCCF